MLRRTPLRQIDVTGADEGDVPTVRARTDGQGMDLVLEQPTNGGAATLDGLTDVDLTDPPEDADALRFDQAAGVWVARPITPAETGALALDDLTDVDLTSSPPTGGQALVFDEAAQQWKAVTISGGGGPTVGAWETKTVTFTVPPATETDLTGAPVALGTTRPTAPTFSLTVGSAHVVGSSDAGFSVDTVLALYAAVQLPGGVANRLLVEVMVNGVVVATADTASTSTATSAVVSASSGRVVTGDQVQVRLWQATANGSLVWWEVEPRSSGGGRASQPAGGGRYLYSGVRGEMTAASFAPIRSFISAVSANYSGFRWRDGDTGFGHAAGGVTADPAATEILNSIPGGIFRPNYFDPGYCAVATGGSSQGGSMFRSTCPTRISFKRLAVPDPPL